MKKNIEKIAVDRIELIGNKIQYDNTKYDEILSKIKSLVSSEVFNLIDDLEGEVIKKQSIFEIEIYKQGFKDGMELKNIL